MALPQGNGVGGRRDHVKEELVAEGVDHPDDLQRERVEIDPVVPAIGGDKRDRVHVARLDDRHRMSEQGDVAHHLVEQSGIASGGLPDQAFQLRKPVRVEHAPSGEISAMTNCAQPATLGLLP
jgi:hypothetical protein